MYVCMYARQKQEQIVVGALPAEHCHFGCVYTYIHTYMWVCASRLRVCIWFCGTNTCEHSMRVYDVVSMQPMEHMYVYRACIQRAHVWVEYVCVCVMLVYVLAGKHHSNL
jgi:hypothetical protein